MQYLERILRLFNNTNKKFLNQLNSENVLNSQTQPSIAGCTPIKISEVIDCLNAYRHSGFYGHSPEQIKEIYDRNDAFITIRKISPNKDQTWPKYSQVSTNI